MPKTKWSMMLPAAVLFLYGGLYLWQQQGDEMTVTGAEGEDASSVFFVWEETQPAAREAPTDAEEGESGEAPSEAPWIPATEPLLVNINTAQAPELEKLPGIGPAKAAAIILYREEHGPFGSIEELMRVPGIKEATFAKLKAYVTV